MEWYHYLSGFGAGLFLANAIPHFVHGVSGNKFPTPFANPPGKGLSSAPVNMYWSLLNMIVGYLLLYLAGTSVDNAWSMCAFFAGVALIGIFLSYHFIHKQKDAD